MTIRLSLVERIRKNTYNSCLREFFMKLFLKSKRLKNTSFTYLPRDPSGTLYFLFDFCTKTIKRIGKLSVLFYSHIIHENINFPPNCYFSHVISHNIQRK